MPPRNGWQPHDDRRARTLFLSADVDGLSDSVSDLPPEIVWSLSCAQWQSAERCGGRPVKDLRYSTITAVERLAMVCSWGKWARTLLAFI